MSHFQVLAPSDWSHNNFFLERRHKGRDTLLCGDLAIQWHVMTQVTGVGGAVLQIISFPSLQVS